MCVCNLDWKALGLDASKARLVAPEIKDFQPGEGVEVGRADHGGTETGVADIRDAIGGAKGDF